MSRSGEDAGVGFRRSRRVGAVVDYRGTRRNGQTPHLISAHELIDSISNSG